MIKPFKENQIKITSLYGNRRYKYRGKIVCDFHAGIDLVPLPCNNNDILAVEDGVIVSVQKIGKQYGQACYVRILHAGGYYTLYYHLKSNSICVNKGEQVTKGQKIGTIGCTGIATGIHLHFQIDYGNNKTAINPYDYLFNDKELSSNNKINIDMYSDDELAKMVIEGKFSNGIERKVKLGNRYSRVQQLVNQKLQSKDNIYIVKNGDTLSSIAKDYNTTWQKIYNDNKKVIGSNPNLIKQGQRLVIK